MAHAPARRGGIFNVPPRVEKQIFGIITLRKAKKFLPRLMRDHARAAPDFAVILPQKGRHVRGFGGDNIREDVRLQHTLRGEALGFGEIAESDGQPVIGGQHVAQPRIKGEHRRAIVRVLQDALAQHGHLRPRLLFGQCRRVMRQPCRAPKQAVHGKHAQISGKHGDTPGLRELAAAVRLARRQKGDQPHRAFGAKQKTEQQQKQDAEGGNIPI